jgi:protein-S-isoprenylcysteine O-methyltransferase Ste14
MADFEARALLVYFVVYFLSAFVWRPLVVYRRLGANPLIAPSGDDAYGYVTRGYSIVALLVGVVVLIIALADDAMKWLGAYRLVQSPEVSATGWILLGIALPWLLIAQAQMGISWRIGIDSQRDTELVRNGLFSLSRNPIYLATRIILFALFLVFPSAATLVLFVAIEILLQVQVRLEEQHLSRTHGDSYATYCSHVRRWL